MQNAAGSRLAVRRPGKFRLALSELANLKTVTGILYSRSCDLGDKTDADQIGYLVQRVEAHAEALRHALAADNAAEATAIGSSQRD